MTVDAWPIAFVNILVLVYVVVMPAVILRVCLRIMRKLD
jgi:hypothetical protein